VIYRELEDELEQRAMSMSLVEDERDGNMTLDDFIDLTLDSDG